MTLYYITDEHYDRHFILYAKSWYRQSDDMLADLKQIMSLRCGMEAAYVRQKDIEAILLQLVYPILKKRDMRATACNFHFEDFVFEVKERPIYEVCLSFLATALTKELPYDIGKPDSRVLPIKHLE